MKRKIIIAAVVIVFLVAFLILVYPQSYQGTCSFYTIEGEKIEVIFDLERYNRMFKTYNLSGNIVIGDKEFETIRQTIYGSEVEKHPFFFFLKEPDSSIEFEDRISFYVIDEKKQYMQILMYEKDETIQYYGPASSAQEAKIIYDIYWRQ